VPTRSTGDQVAQDRSAARAQAQSCSLSRNGAGREVLRPSLAGPGQRRPRRPARQFWSRLHDRRHDRLVQALTSTCAMGPVTAIARRDRWFAPDGDSRPRPFPRWTWPTPASPPRPRCPGNHSGSGLPGARQFKQHPRHQTRRGAEVAGSRGPVHVGRSRGAGHVGRHVGRFTWAGQWAVHVGRSRGRVRWERLPPVCPGAGRRLRRSRPVFAYSDQRTSPITTISREGAMEHDGAGHA